MFHYSIRKIKSQSSIQARGYEAWRIFLTVLSAASVVLHFAESPQDLAAQKTSRTTSYNQSLFKGHIYNDASLVASCKHRFDYCLRFSPHAIRIHFSTGG